MRKAVIINGKEKKDGFYIFRVKNPREHDVLASKSDLTKKIFDALSKNRLDSKIEVSFKELSSQPLKIEILEVIKW